MTNFSVHSSASGEKIWKGEIFGPSGAFTRIHEQVAHGKDGAKTEVRLEFLSTWYSGVKVAILELLRFRFGPAEQLWRSRNIFTYVVKKYFPRLDSQVDETLTPSQMEVLVAMNLFLAKWPLSHSHLHLTAARAFGKTAFQHPEVSKTTQMFVLARLMRDPELAYWHVQDAEDKVRAFIKEAFEQDAKGVEQGWKSVARLAIMVRDWPSAEEAASRDDSPMLLNGAKIYPAYWMYRFKKKLTFWR